jgi:hypothetical protein
MFPSVRVSQGNAVSGKEPQLSRLVPEKTRPAATTGVPAAGVMVNDPEIDPAGLQKIISQTDRRGFVMEEKRGDR